VDLAGDPILHRGAAVEDLAPDFEVRRPPLSHAPGRQCDHRHVQLGGEFFEGHVAGEYVVNFRGFVRAWTTDGFKTSWAKAFDRAGLGDEDLHFHDLRGTAVTRLALSGCTVPEIAAINYRTQPT
jgi:integrase